MWEIALLLALGLLVGMVGSFWVMIYLHEKTRLPTIGADLLFFALACGITGLVLWGLNSMLP